MWKSSKTAGNYYHDKNFTNSMSETWGKLLPNLPRKCLGCGECIVTQCSSGQTFD